MVIFYFIFFTLLPKHLIKLKYDIFLVLVLESYKKKRKHNYNISITLKNISMNNIPHGTT